MNDAPDLILVGGTDELELEPGGKVYRPGDVMPSSLSYDRRLQLQAAGIRFETRHSESMPAPEPAAEVEPVAAEQPRRAAKE